MPNESSREVVTLRDVAREAGVSAQSVSIVLNGKAEQYRISRATQERIEKMARELGYDPESNRSARQMAARKHGVRVLTNIVAVCSNPNMWSLHRQPFESEILDGIESVADEQGMDVLMCRVRSGRRLPRLLERGEVDGIIAVSSSPDTMAALRALRIPFIKTGSALSEAHSVSAKHREGMQIVTSHLIELGHREIAYIGLDASRSEEKSVMLSALQNRFAGFCAEMRKAGLPINFEGSSITDTSCELGASAFRQLWEQSQGQATAVVCYNDILAMGVIQAANELGLKIPEDLSVVGFDAISDKYNATPFITSVGYDRELMGKRAMEILVQHRFGENPGKYICEELPVHFVEGATTAPPRKDS